MLFSVAALPECQVALTTDHNDQQIYITVLSMHLRNVSLTKQTDEVMSRSIKQTASCAIEDPGLHNASLMLM